MNCYDIRGLTFTYPAQERPALRDVDVSIRQGEYVAICGKSGCGKSTLLRHLKTVLTPHGEIAGELRFFGRPLAAVELRDQAAQIGFVLQDPDNQIVTDKVWHELAFGLESLGADARTIRLRVAEMASYFGIQTWFHRRVTELSGGQKQLLNLASIMAMQPSVLILDEPTSQLDPIAAADFLNTIRKINQELGTTIIITEHRLEDVFPYADRVLVMDEGRIIADGTPQQVGAVLKTSKNDMFAAMPSPIRIYAGVDSDLPCPLTVRDGRNWLSDLLGGREIARRAIGEEEPLTDGGAAAIRLKDVWFRYEKELPDVVKGVTLTIPKGQLTAIVGGNGTGKSTTVKLIAGVLKPYRGKVWIFDKEIGKYKGNSLFEGNLACLPQDPQALFVKNRVDLDLAEALSGMGLSKEEKQTRLTAMAELVEIDRLLDRHPFDLSGGEKQRAALAKVLLLEPKLLLLDEPTKGIDNFFKQKLAEILKKLTDSGVTIVMVSHDIEFCARYADRCAMFFDGDVVTTDTPRRFFSGNSFYTTAANRLSRHIFADAVTNEDVIALCRQALDERAAERRADERA